MADTCETCPECGKDLQRNEDPHGVTYQCLAHDCLSLFVREEIEAPQPRSTNNG